MEIRNKYKIPLKICVYSIDKLKSCLEIRNNLRFIKMFSRSFQELFNTVLNKVLRFTKTAPDVFHRKSVLTVFENYPGRNLRQTAIFVKLQPISVQFY